MYHIEFDLDFKRNTYPGKFIAFEGIDASGKSTQVQLLQQELEKQGKKVTVKNPFEGEIGKFIRRILSGEIHVPPVAIQYLISANRQVQQEEIIEHLKNGEYVIIDRYIWSAVAYGIMDKGNGDFKKVGNWLLIEQSILSMYHQFLLPNVTFYLDISADTAMERLAHVDRPKEIYEERSKVEKSVETYKWLLSEFSNEFVIINGEKSEEEVAREILKYVESSM